MKQQTSATTETQNKGRNFIDYSGKTLYVGIDVHQKDYQVAVVFESSCLNNHRMPASASKLIDYLHKHFPGASFKCVYESSAWGFNLQRKLSGVGIDCIVVNAADVATSDKERRRKTDAVDALKLAREHQSHNLEAIHVPDEEMQKQRDLIRLRKRLVGDLGRSKNRLKSSLKYNGIDIPEALDKSNWSNNFLTWVEQEANKDPILKVVLLLMLEEIKLLRALLLKTEKEVRKLMKTEKYLHNATLVSSIPGIGPVITALFLLEIGDIGRFKTFDKLCNFIGLCPDTYSSGETDRDTGITRRKHNQLRTALIEASWTALRKDPALMDTYSKLTKRMEGNKAVIRISRKLLRRLRAVLISGIPYQKGIVC